MSTQPPEQPAFCDVYFKSTVGPNQYRYESPLPWEKLPLMLYEQISEASYPDLKRVLTQGDKTHDFPEHDMFIKEKGKVPILFTGAHNRLLYEITSGVIPLRPNAKRSLINIDHHDDIMLGSVGYDPYDVHIGNWVAAGAVNGYWGNYVHLDEGYEPRLPLTEIKPSQEAIPVELVRQSLPVYRISTAYNF